MLYKKANFKKVGFSTMAFTAKILSWRFRHLNYCRLFAQKKAYQGGVTGTPGPPLTMPLLLYVKHQKIYIISAELFSYSIQDIAVTVLFRYKLHFAIELEDGAFFALTDVTGENVTRN